MNKQEFLEKLRKKLSVLKTSEIDDIISEYGEYIDDKIANGSSEEEAVKGFGNIDDLTAEILDAYNIDPKQTKINIDEETIKKGATKTKDTFNQIVNYLHNFFTKTFSGLSTNDIIKMLILFLVAAIVVKIPFAIIEGLVLAIIRLIFGDGLIYSLVQTIISLLINVIYLFAIVIMVIALYNALKQHKEIDLATIIKSPFVYLNGNKDLDPSTTKTIDNVSNTINDVANRATRTIDQVIADAKKRSEQRENHTSSYNETSTTQSTMKQETGTNTHFTPDDEADDVIRETFSADENPEYQKDYHEGNAFLRACATIFKVVVTILIVCFWIAFICAIIGAAIVTGFVLFGNLPVGIPIIILGGAIICKGWIDIFSVSIGKKAVNLASIIIAFAIGGIGIAVGINLLGLLITIF